MLSVYLFAMILGGVLLSISLFGGHHAADTHPADLDHGGTLAHDSEHPAEDQHDRGALAHSLIPGIFSIRAWTYLLAFGGATGLLLRLLAKVGEPTAALVSLGVGIITGGFARAVIGRAARMGTEGTLSERDMIGRVATVLVPFGGAETGKVRLQVKDTTLDMLAVSEDGRELRQRDEVVVVEFKDGRALVAGANDLHKG